MAFLLEIKCFLYCVFEFSKFTDPCFRNNYQTVEINLQ